MRIHINLILKDNKINNSNKWGNNIKESIQNSKWKNKKLSCCKKMEAKVLKDKIFLYNNSNSNNNSNKFNKIHKINKNN